MDLDWKEKAACKGVGVDLFFNRRSPDKKREQEALCASCPVKKDCLEYALKLEIAENCGIGIWGGLTPKERILIKRG